MDLEIFEEKQENLAQITKNSSIQNHKKNREISIFQRVIISKRIYFGPFCKEGRDPYGFETFLEAHQIIF